MEKGSKGKALMRTQSIIRDAVKEGYINPKKKNWMNTGKSKMKSTHKNNLNNNVHHKRMQKKKKKQPPKLRQ